ncbi:hypothetical protein ILYODFUR_009912, partial [Ilyodon furcidens]
MDDYDDDDDFSTSSGLKKLGASLGLKLRPWEGAGGVRSAKSEVSLIDFTDDSFSSTTPSPLTETHQPDEDTLKDTPSILDWPLPQPAYDEVTADFDDQSEDQEVRSINKGPTEEALGPLVSSMTGRSESQSADLFQELQREVMVKLQVPMATGRSLPSSPTPMPLAPFGAHRQIYLPPPSPSSSSTSVTSCYEDRPVLPPRSPVPPLRPSKHSYTTRSAQQGARSSSISLGDEDNAPPQIPPRDHAFSQPGSRSSSPLPLAPALSSTLVALPPPPLSASPRRAAGLLGPLLSTSSQSSSSSHQAALHASRLAASSYSSTSLLEPLTFPDGRGLSSLMESPQNSAPVPLPERPAFLERYGAANMAAVKPMMQQPGGPKPNSSYNNNNGRTVVPSMQQEHSIKQVQGVVHGVTMEECKAALQSHNWSVPQAVNYLK